MLRIIKLQLPEVAHDELLEMLDEAEFVRLWTGDDQGRTRVEILVTIDQSEALVAHLEERFGDQPDFRLVILPVEATVPRLESDEEEDDEEPAADATDAEQEADEENRKAPPISVEELRDDVTTGMQVDGTYAAMTLLSTLVAVVGITRNDVTIVIAAMIIAPLLKPNMAMSLATTLADSALAKRALRVNLAGLVIAFLGAVAMGALLPVDPTAEQIALRTRAGILEIILACSAGAAGALSFTTGQAGPVVGVMVAVALLPPVVVCGMLLGGGHANLAVGAAYLSVANIVCVNLAGVVTFFAQRIRPRTAWESKRAEQAFRWAVLIWLALLAVLVAVVAFGETFRRYP